MEFKNVTDVEALERGARFLHDFWVRETISISKENPSITLEVKESLLKNWVPFLDLPMIYREAYYIKANELITFLFDITD